MRASSPVGLEEKNAADRSEHSEDPTSAPLAIPEAATSVPLGKLLARITTALNLGSRPWTDSYPLSSEVLALPLAEVASFAANQLSSHEDDTTEVDQTLPPAAPGEANVGLSALALAALVALRIGRKRDENAAGRRLPGQGLTLASTRRSHRERRAH